MDKRSVDRIGALLPSVLEGARKRQGTFDTVQREWRRLVGKPLADHARPVSLRRGRLVVQVDHPGDGFALSYQRARLLEQLRTATGEKIKEIVIRPCRT